MSPLDLHINDGYLPMVDGTLVYHRGFGDRRTAVKDPKPSLFVSPRVFLRNGFVVASRTYPLKAAMPPLGAAVTGNQGPAQSRGVPRAPRPLGQLLPRPDPHRRNRQYHQHPCD